MCMQHVCGLYVNVVACNHMKLSWNSLPIARARTHTHVYTSEPKLTCASPTHTNQKIICDVVEQAVHLMPPQVLHVPPQPVHPRHGHRADLWHGGSGTQGGRARGFLVRVWHTPGWHASTQPIPGGGSSGNPTFGASILGLFKIQKLPLGVS